ncbi:MAG: hypothetical protein EOO88_01320 [Pedobacter sp.]|nr:MAG: hypothetical protein EOO88_01320 [Pedobacter sp.]
MFVRNGLLKQGREADQYCIIVSEGAREVQVVFAEGHDTVAYSFRVLSPPLPVAEALGPRNQDNMIVAFKGASTGLGVRFREFPFNAKFVVDSFDVSVKHKGILTIHRNIGQQWDSGTRTLLENSKPDTFVIISNFYCHTSVRKFFFARQILYYIPEF